MSAVNSKKFIQITSGPAGLCALDELGQVWKYIPASEPKRFAFWTKLTGHRADPADKPSPKPSEPPSE